MKKLYLTIIILTLILTGFLTYHRFAFFNLNVKFDELEPFDKQVNVYYKGFKIGKTVKIYPDKEYKYTYLKLRISPPDVMLPDNIIARFENKTQNRYINLIAPDDASVTKLKDGDTIQGIATKDLNGLLADTLQSGTVDSVLEGASNVLNSANSAMEELTALLANVNSVVDDVRGDLKKVSSNLAKTSAQISELSENVNSSLDKKSVKFSADNLVQTTENIKDISDNLNSVSKQIDEVTLPSVNSVLCETEGMMENANEISEGVKHTLKKRMGMFRLFFGKPVPDCECY